MTTLSVDRKPLAVSEGSPAPSNRRVPSPIHDVRGTTEASYVPSWIGTLTLVALWAWQLWYTWGGWGDFTIDSGHEMYVPWMLAQGKMLYRDVWFMYPPAGPYFNSYLFRIFGAHLNVLYWAGSLAALGSALLLFFAGGKLESRIAGWTAGAVILLEAFGPTLFCFPLPYSFSTVYACLVGCAFLWFVVNAWESQSWGWLFAAGTAAAAALLLKPEFGIACYATVALLTAAKSYAQKSWKPLAMAGVASLPGVVCCALVLRWMISIAGVQFITQENIMSWPSSYFMRAYGKLWLEGTGFTVSRDALLDAFFRAIPLLGIVVVLGSVRWWKRSGASANMLRAALAAGVGVLLWVNNYWTAPRSAGEALRFTLASVFFPQDMVLYVILAALVAWMLFLRRGGPTRFALPALAMSYAALLSFRILMGMAAEKYPIYYNGPVVLCFLYMAFLLLPVGSIANPSGDDSRAVRARRIAAGARLAFSAGTLAVVFLTTHGPEVYARQNLFPMETDRGTAYLTKNKAEQYQAAIRFMKQKAAMGEAVMSVPEDTSLYFLAGTECPTRVYQFTPGSLAPGKMTDETIAQIEAGRVRYLIWSNRIFPEYGTPVFGTNFDVPLGDYLKAHYRPVGRLVQTKPSMWHWTAMVWERNLEPERVGPEGIAPPMSQSAPPPTSH